MSIEVKGSSKKQQHVSDLTQDDTKDTAKKSSEACPSSLWRKQQPIFLSFRRCQKIAITWIKKDGFWQVFSECHRNV
ncbi:hypothetical protein ATANTOWER_009804 [Ataeniobius toweri]|uniref:Uncharacterized protein n=1 Tax=Ataeniobius toweri TaxID=208326 RepID=A0ABU7AP50_9TELE|nr:hypothetical protein [Ataeniobius toweri]